MGQMHKVSKNNTTISDDGDTLEIVLHRTLVVKVVRSLGRIRLATGGWPTVTTQARMNQAANEYGLPYRVSRKDGELFVTTRFDEYYIPARGIVINFEGEEQ